MQFELDIIAMITAIGGLLWYVNKRYVRPWFVNQSLMFLAIPKIEKIYEQVTPNGGSSFRDAVDRIEVITVGLEQKLSAYMMDTRHGIFETDDKGNYIWVNRTYCRMLGKRESEMLGKSWVNCVHEDERDRVLKSWNYALENTIEFNLIFKMVTNDGVILPVHAHANPMTNGKKVLIGYLGIIEETI
jgi:PAS domain S-box-containing protein